MTDGTDSIQESRLDTVKQPAEDKDGLYETPVIRKENGEIIGVTLCLTEEDLAELDVRVDSEKVLLYGIIEGGKIRIRNK